MRQGERLRRGCGEIRALFGRGSVQALMCFALVAAMPTPAQGQSARALVQEGNRLYQEGRFQEAHEKYMEAMAESPDSPVIPFNAGNALYQDADYQRAMEAYQEAIASGDPELASDAWYNLGNALYRQQQLQPSLEAYKQALRLDPRDVDAKHNFERVLQELQQQQQQPQDQQSQDDEQEPEEGEQPPQDGSPQPQDGSQGQQPPEGEEGDDEQPEGEGEQPPGEEPQDQEPEQGDGDPEQGEGQGQPQPRDGEMTEEEARRLLDALDEDPGDVNRRPASARGRRPTKPW